MPWKTICGEGDLPTGSKSKIEKKVKVKFKIKEREIKNGLWNEKRPEQGTGGKEQ